jgi:hypothetical protein
MHPIELGYFAADEINFRRINSIVASIEKLLETKIGTLIHSQIH